MSGPPRQLPPYAHVVRGLAPGLHRFLEVLPGAADSPAMVRIANERIPAGPLLASTHVLVEPGQGFAYVDVERPSIVLRESYYRTGDDLDLYLDLLHELTHIRQLHEGFDLWHREFEYVDRITEVEGYAVAVEEGRRLGMSDEEVLHHLSNPWMDEDDVQRLLDHIHHVLAGRQPESPDPRTLSTPRP